jgi:SET domain-containing protein
MQEVKHYQKISVKRSSLHGWGVFADDDISANEMIEIAPGVMLEQSFLNACHYVAKAEGLKPEEIMLDQYGIGWTDGRAFFPLGWVGLYNHSDDPSAEFVYVSDELVGIRSTKSIQLGEEITVNYGDHWWKQKGYLQKL